MPLVPAVVEVPLTPLNQVPSDTMGPLGRLQHLIDGQITKYEPHYTGATGVVPAKVKVGRRDPFVSLPTTARSVIDGTTTTPPVTPPELLAPLGNQLLSISSDQARVWNGANWTSYPNDRVITRKLTQDVLHTSQHTIQAPDQAWLNGVTCAVWTETVVTSTGPLTTSYVGFKADNGAWIVQPAALYASNASFVAANARVVQDGTHFWVFHGTSVNGIVVTVYDTNGALLNSFTNISPPLHNFVPSGWDVAAVPSTGGYTVLCAVVTDGTSDVGATLTALKISGGTVSQNAVAITSPTIHADWQLAFLTNDTGNGRSYLATVMSGGTEQVWAYEITNQAVTNTYNTGVSVAGGVVDTIAGYVTSSSGVAVVLSYCSLPDTTATTGPTHDPQLRLIHSFATVAPNITTHIRTTQSMAQVSRAFAVDGEYYVMGYYQSGSGLTVTPVTNSIVGQAGDTMIGSATQPITVQAGDSTEGSPIHLTSSGASLYVSTGHGAANIQTGDRVDYVSVNGLSASGVPDGTPALRWRFSFLAASNTLYNGSRMVVSGSSNPAANYTWDIYGLSSDGLYFYTPVTDISQSSNGPIGPFTIQGAVTLTSMTLYQVQDFSALVTSDLAANTYVGGGTFVVSGAAHSGNNGTFVPRRVYVGTGPTWGLGTLNGASGVWVNTTTQASFNDSFTAVLSGDTPNGWTFRSEAFDASYVGANLVISADPLQPANVVTSPITSVVNANMIITGGASGVLPQAFTYPFPTAAIQLTTQVPYTFKFAAVTPDYTYQGALMVIQGATDAVNNGTYQIIQINVDGSFIATPTNGLTNQVNEAMGPSQTVTFFLPSSVQAPFQSTWFVVPITGAQPVAGRFEYGLAYADWRTEGDTAFGLGQFPMCLSTPAMTSNGLQFTLPYRAQNVTSAVVQLTAAGQVDVGDEAFSSTTGLKRFWLENAHGNAYQNSGELLIPGPMATVFTPSGFHEDNVNLALELPFLVSQSVATAGQLALTTGATYFYVAVAEYTDENGNRIFSPPSPALQVNMSGTNNKATIGGRLMFPLSTAGAPVANTYGPTTRQVTISIYRTAWINGVPTTQRYKITNDLNPNGVAPVSTLNQSGFSFPDSFTWNYVDQNADSTISANEILYTDKGYLPRYPAPAFSGGVASWKNREWVLGYDGAIWMSGEKTEGDAIWFNPLFRYVLPTDDEPMALASLEDYLLVFCARSVWYIPTAQFPDSTGANGALPTPVQLNFPNGSANGFACQIRDGVAYDSTAGGLWMVTRSLENVWLGEPVKDTLTGVITGLTLDTAQRLFVQQAGSTVMCVYDRTPQAWYEWRAPTQGLLLATYQGQAIYQDSANVNAVTPSAAADVVNGVTSGIALDVTLAPIGIGNVRGLKHVWEFQAVGEYKGPHRLNVVLSYPEDDVPSTIYAPFTAIAGKAYVIPFNPLQETASMFGIRLYVDFVGVGSPGESCTLELIAAQVGMEPIGLSKRPAFVTLTTNR